MTMSYFLLFFSALIAATLFPMQSEAVLFTLLYQSYTAWLLILVATMGNVLGSCINWFLGIKIEQYKHHKYFPFKEQQIVKAQKFYAKYGFYSLFLSWLPIIGDPLTLIAGVLKERFWRFIIIVTVAKLSRYLFIYWIFLHQNI